MVFAKDVRTAHVGRQRSGRNCKCKIQWWWQGNRRRRSLKTPLPKPIELPSGQSTITVQKPAFLPFTKTLTVRGRQNERETIKLELASRYADVEVSVTGAPNAIVKIDNIERGPAPSGQVEVRPEPHQFEASANGFLPATDSRVAVEGQKLSMTLALAKDTGRVRELIRCPRAPKFSLMANQWAPTTGRSCCRGQSPADGEKRGVLHTYNRRGRSCRWDDRANGVTRRKQEHQLARLGYRCHRDRRWKCCCFSAYLQSHRHTVPGTLRTVEQTPVPAAFRFSMTLSNT